MIEQLDRYRRTLTARPRLEWLHHRSRQHSQHAPLPGRVAAMADARARRPWAARRLLSPGLSERLVSGRRDAWWSSYAGTRPTATVAPARRGKASSPGPPFRANEGCVRPGADLIAERKQGRSALLAPPGRGAAESADLREVPGAPAGPPLRAKDRRVSAHRQSQAGGARRHPASAAFTRPRRYSRHWRPRSPAWTAYACSSTRCVHWEWRRRSSSPWRSTRPSGA